MVARALNHDVTNRRQLQTRNVTNSRQWLHIEGAGIPVKPTLAAW